MNHIGKTIGKSWMTFWEVVLAFVFGMFLFAMLNVVSAGLLITLVTAAVCFAVLASIHYLLWGRDFSWMVIRQHRTLEPHDSSAGAAPTLDDFVVELNDAERKELMQLLERSLAEKTDAREKTRRQELLNQLRMFGA